MGRPHHTIEGATEDYHLATLGEYPSATGLEVGAAATDVTMLGLAVEHTVGDLVVWRGDRGRTWFYQSELPYDVDQATFGDLNFTGYRVLAGDGSYSSSSSSNSSSSHNNDGGAEAMASSSDGKDKKVFEHEAAGVGVYSFFRDHPCVVAAAVVCPGDGKEAPTTSAGGAAASGVRFQNTFTRHLNGKGTIASVINGNRGTAVGPEGPLLMQLP